MKPTDRPTPPQLRLLKGLADGHTLWQVHARFRVHFVHNRAEFSMDTLSACIKRAWVAEGWVKGKTKHDDLIRITSISDLGRKAIARAVTPARRVNIYPRKACG